MDLIRKVFFWPERSKLPCHEFHGETHEFHGFLVAENQGWLLDSGGSFHSVGNQGPQSFNPRR